MIAITDKIQPGEHSKSGGMEGAVHITDSDGNQNVFELKRNNDGKTWLNGNWASPDDKWNLDNEIVFRLRNCVYFSFACAREFCLDTFPYQPPSILPITSSFSDISA